MSLHLKAVQVSHVWGDCFTHHLESVSSTNPKAAIMLLGNFNVHRREWLHFLILVCPLINSFFLLMSLSFDIFCLLTVVCIFIAVKYFVMQIYSIQCKTRVRVSVCIKLDLYVVGTYSLVTENSLKLSFSLVRILKKTMSFRVPSVVFFISICRHQ